MTARNRYTAEDASGIDLTPMLDVVFIMLIFFIVTASFIKEVSIPIDRPPPGQSIPPDAEPRDVTVTLKADNQIYIKSLRIDHRSLRAHFERHAAKQPQSAVIIRASEGAKTYGLVQIADAARQAGLVKVVVMDVK